MGSAVVFMEVATGAEEHMDPSETAPHPNLLESIAQSCTGTTRGEVTEQLLLHDKGERLSLRTIRPQRRGISPSQSWLQASRRTGLRASTTTDQGRTAMRLLLALAHLIK